MKQQVNKGGAVKARIRRIEVIKWLEKQLKDGTKNVKAVEATQSGKTWNEPIPLTEHDISRIKREIDVLKTRI